jgi:hypothetical protein
MNAGPVVLVDGENVRRSLWPNIEASRLVELCAAWAEGGQRRVVVAFDGSAPSTEVPRVTLVGTGGDSADDWIAEEAARLVAAGEPYWLVTSDRELRGRAGAGAERTIGGGSFARELVGGGYDNRR